MEKESLFSAPSRSVGFAIGIAILIFWYGIELGKSTWPELDLSNLVKVIGFLALIWAITRDSLNNPQKLATTKSDLALLSIVVIVSYGLVLEIHWVSPAYNYFSLGGLIPNSDAEGWLSGGWRLLETAKLNAFDQVRPLNAALHALRLAVSADFQESVKIATLAMALATIFAGFQVTKEFHRCGAIVFCLCSLALINDYIPLAMTEVHGFILGTLGFAFLWRFAQNPTIVSFGLGITFFALALSARSGLFTSLGLVFFWGLWILFKRGYSVKEVLSAGMMCALSGFIVSKMYLMLWADGENLLFSNFSFTLYGMAVGGGGWTQVLQDYPMYFDHSDGIGVSEVRIVYQLAMDAILSNPQQIVEFYFGQLWFFLKSFIRYDIFLVGGNYMGAFFQASCLISGIWAILNWRNRAAQLGLCLAFGIWIASPFLMLDAGIRPFSTLFAVFAVIPGIALVVILGLISTWTFSGVGIDLTPKISNDQHRDLCWSNSIGILFVVLIVVGPIYVVQTYEPITAFGKTSSCQTGEESIILNGDNSVLIGVMSPANVQTTRLPKIEYDEFLKLIPGPENDPNRQKLENHHPPFLLINSRTYGRIFIDGVDEAPNKNSVVACLRQPSNGDYKVGYFPK